ncbi:hypothetical protein ACOTI8_31015 [Achromobacter xylosoxidans]
MASDLILTTAQAQAVYSAMCALNNIGAVIDVEIPGGCGGTRIQGTFTGSVRVEQRWDDRKSERYPDQDAFAASYGLRAVPDAADLLAALNTAHMALIGYLPAHRNAVTDAAIETCRATIARNSA